MENRFGVKDLFMFGLMAALLVMVVLSMVQFDRQFKDIQEIKKQNSNLTSDLQRVKSRLEQGIVMGSGGGAGGQLPEQLPVFKPLVEAEKKPDFARGDWLVDNFGTKIGRLTPLVSSDLYQQWIEARVCEGLATRDPNTLEFQPLLAESWEIKDYTKEWEAYVGKLRKPGQTAEEFTKAVKADPNVPLAMELVFKLRRGVSFSDGEPFTADDVKFTFDWILTEAVNAARARAYLTNLKAVRVDNPHQVTFQFTEPYYGTFETITSLAVMSKKFYSRFTPQQFNDKVGLLIGTGPYRLADPENWSPGNGVTLVKNERYWGVPGTFDRMIWRELEDESAEIVTFGNGEMDIFACQPEQYEKLLKDPKIVAMSQHLKYPSPLNGYTYLGWNQRRKDAKGVEAATPFADKRVRQAMTMLIDRERIAREVFLGYATVATGPFDPNGPQADPAIKPWPYDEAKAKALLAQAGFADKNNDGVVDGPDGRPFRFKLSYPSGNATYQRVILFLKDSFARAGVTMEPDPLDWPVLVQRLKQGNFDACTLGWGGVVESDPYQIFHSSQIAGEGDNRTHYVNKELDVVIEQARQTLDDKKRMDLWHKAHQILHEDQPYTFFFNRPSLVFINGRIKNVGVTKLGLNYVRLLPNPSPWYVPKAGQRYSK
ncbi:MAG TPA: ABC transporter substrate-binding protein [Tepidisphaeraceae bacterium]|nr:ABC transporter substrate-binding protein [Tepidisphaeraceae bacterium]